MFKRNDWWQKKVPALSQSWRATHSGWLNFLLSADAKITSRQKIIPIHQAARKLDEERGEITLSAAQGAKQRDMRPGGHK